MTQEESLDHIIRLRTQLAALWRKAKSHIIWPNDDLVTKMLLEELENADKMLAETKISHID